MTPDPRLAEIAKEISAEWQTDFSKTIAEEREDYAIAVAQKYAEHREQKVCSECGDPEHGSYSCSGRVAFPAKGPKIYRHEYEAREKR